MPPGDPVRRRASAGRNMDTFHGQSYNVAMKQIPAAKFKEQCLSLIDRVDKEGIVITKRGRPVAKLVALSADSASLIGSLRDKVTITGDILSTGARWDAER
jgi:prevent-host-death family protein